MEYKYELSEGRIILSDDLEGCLKLIAEGIPAILILDKNSGENIPGIPYAVTRRALDTPGVVNEEYLNRVIMRFKHKPWHILDTERCSLRELTADDLDSIYGLYTDESILAYTEGPHKDRDKELEYMEKYIRQVYEAREIGSWGVFLKGTDSLIGRAGYQFVKGSDIPELEYVIAAPYQRHGYATEVCSAVLEYGREKAGLKTVNLRIISENTASIALAGRLGFVFTDKFVRKEDGRSILRYTIQL